MQVAEPFALPLVVDAAGTVLNTCAPVASGSARTLTLTLAGDADSFPPGMRVVVMQVQDDFADPGDPAPIASAGSAGQFADGRVLSAVGPTLTLEAPLGAVFGSAGTRRAQVCTLPAFTDVFVLASASILAPAWNGTSGGFVGLVASGTLHLDGTVSADGAGFRGGIRYGNGGGSDEIDLVSADPNRYGGVGEGLDRRGWTQVGVGNRANGGGGGGAYNSGGGGGGSAGAGGLGASQAGPPDPVNPATAGRAGAAVLDSSRLAFGGGGGAGHQNNLAGGDGGAGGGIVYLDVGRLAGAGGISANGADGGDSVNPEGSSDGAGGGGAGGSVRISAGEVDFAGSLRAEGGAGGDLDRELDRIGVGGGGGGGRVLVYSDAVRGSGSFSRSVVGGRAGQTPAGVTHDAEAGASGDDGEQPPL